MEAFTLIKTFLPYGISAIIGASIAWSIQGDRIDSARLETRQCNADHDDYVNQQVAERLEYERAAKARSDAAGAEYAAVEAELRENIQRFDVYRRCVDAGKCGARVQYSLSACKPTDGIQTTFGADGTSTNAVPATGEPAAEGTQGSVLVDCSVATLRANYLQNLIERQPGYFDEH